MIQCAAQALPVDASAFQAEQGGSIPTAPLCKHDWEVRPCRLELAQDLVERFHYAHGGSNTATYVHGLFPRGGVWDRECVGVAWWIPPTKSSAKRNYPKNWQGVLSLSRVVCTLDAPKNSCSFLIRHSMRFIDRRAWPCLVTYADEWQGHGGGIYEALRDIGWRFDGFTKPTRVYVKDGRMIARKATKTRTHAEMLALGCECVGKFRKKRFVNRASEKAGLA